MKWSLANEMYIMGVYFLTVLKHLGIVLFLFMWLNFSLFFGLQVSVLLGNIGMICFFIFFILYLYYIIKQNEKKTKKQ